ncbi:hypothetical protein FHG87_000012 [Trinorchestia longiramus]|nr:hypothetical protein FHG87_000012 [Trinorchestia longiramus]
MKHHELIHTVILCGTHTRWNTRISAVCGPHASRLIVYFLKRPNSSTTSSTSSISSTSIISSTSSISSTISTSSTSSSSTTSTSSTSTTSNSSTSTTSTSSTSSGGSKEIDYQDHSPERTHGSFIAVVTLTLSSFVRS